MVSDEEDDRIQSETDGHPIYISSQKRYVVNVSPHIFTVFNLKVVVVVLTVHIFYLIILLNANVFEFVLIL